MKPGKQTVESPNFSFLAEVDPFLFEIAASAENAFTKDPNSTLVKLRQLAEQLVRTLAAQVGVPSSRATSFIDLIAAVSPRLQMDAKVVRLIHHLRVKGNDAVHEYTQSYGDAVNSLRSARELCLWYYRAFGSPRDSFRPGPFIEPRDWNQEESTLRTEVDELRALLEKERASTSESSILIENLRRQEQALRTLVEERVRDAEVSFALAEEQSREVDRLKADFELRLKQRAAAVVSGHDDYDDVATRAREAAQLASADSAPQFSLVDAFVDDQLTDDQSRLVAQLQQFLGDPTSRIFQMTGYAGTGKTFVTRGLSNFLAATGRKCVLMAPTGKAARVLTQKSGRMATTIHRKIYSINDVKEYRVQGLEGSETFKLYAELCVNGDADNTVYIVDEASMVSDVYSEGEFFRFGTGKVLSDLFKYVNLDHNDHDKKLIFIGDPAQLPPVGMSFSPALSTSYLTKRFGAIKPGKYELTEVVRHEADSGILRAASDIRSSIRKATFARLEFDQAEDLQLLPSHEALVENYLEVSGNKVSDTAMIIAWSNADVASLNELVRNRLFPGQPHACVRDKLVVVTNCTVGGTALNNGDLVYLTRIDSKPETRTINLKSKNPDSGVVTEVEIELRFRDAQIGYRDFAGNSCYADVKILENLLYNDHPNLSSDESKALYIDFRIRNPNLAKLGRVLRDELRADPYFNALRVKFGYALTCHKAQGSEWHTAFVNCRMGGSGVANEGFFRWMYTAITRAKSRLFLLHAPSLKPWGDVKPLVPASQSVEPVGTTELVLVAEQSREDASATGYSRDQVKADSLDARLDTAVISVLGEMGGLVLGIDHHSYMVSVHVASNDSVARVNISYNGKGVIGSITPVPRSELGMAIAARLASLIGRRFSQDETPNRSSGKFDRVVFNEFYPEFLASARAQGLEILHVVEEVWNLRLTITNSKTQAQVSIYCDGKGRINKTAWVGKPPSDRSLLDAFNRALSEM